MNFTRSFDVRCQSVMDKVVENKGGREDWPRFGRTAPVSSELPGLVVLTRDKKDILIIPESSDTDLSQKDAAGWRR